MTLAAILLMPESEPRAPTSTTSGRHFVSASSTLQSMVSIGLSSGAERERERERERGERWTINEGWAVNEG